MLPSRGRLAKLQVCGSPRLKAGGAESHHGGLPGGKCDLGLGSVTGCTTSLLMEIGGPFSWHGHYPNARHVDPV